MELRLNSIICAFYIDGVRSVAEQFGLQNPNMRDRPRGGMTRELFLTGKPPPM
jgi:hypothetical protein